MVVNYKTEIVKKYPVGSIVTSDLTVFKIGRKYIELKSKTGYFNILQYSFYDFYNEFVKLKEV